MDELAIIERIRKEMTDRLYEFEMLKLMVNEAYNVMEHTTDPRELLKQFINHYEKETGVTVFKRNPVDLNRETSYS